MSGIEIVGIVLAIPDLISRAVAAIKNVRCSVLDGEDDIEQPP